MGIVRAARSTGRAVGRSRKGIPHTLSSSRAAQIHRWQLLGAAARKGQKRGAKSGHHNALAKARKGVVGTYAATAAKGTARILLPTSLITPAIPGWQPGDKLPGAGRFTRRRK